MSYGDWRDDLRPASFRGVSFSVSADEAQCGRKIVRHDYIGKNYPYIEDLGKSAREFSVDAIIIGSDYAARRDRLMRACELSGSGVLIHPYYGRIVVTLSAPLRIAHRKDEGAMCSVSLQFVRTDPLALAAAPNDEFSSTITAAGAALDKINAGFAAVFSVTGQVSYVVDAARTKVNAAITAIRGIKAQARKLSEFNQKIGQLTADVNTLLLTPGDLVNSLHEAMCFDFGGGNLTNPYNLTAKLADFWELRNLFTYGEDDEVPAGTAPSVVQEAANQNAIKNLIQTSAVILTARMVADIEFPSKNDALLVRGIVVDKIDSILESTTDDDLFLSLLSLKSYVVKNIEIRAADLAALQTFTPIANISSLVLAHKLYGNLNYEQDIIDRNKTRNPALIPGSVPLEVLSA